MAFLWIATGGVVISPPESISKALTSIKQTLAKVPMAAMDKRPTR